MLQTISTFFNLRAKYQDTTFKCATDHQKSKKFLEEDHKWKQHNDEEALSLLSISFDDEETITVKQKPNKARLYPLIFLGAFILTNIFPMISTCYNNPQSIQCNGLNKNGYNSIYKTLFEIGTLSSVILSIMIFYHIFELQKSSLSTFLLNKLGNKLVANFILGCCVTLLWVSYVMSRSSSNFLSKAVLNLYLLSVLAYSIINQIYLRMAVDGFNDKKRLNKTLFFLVKNTYYYTMMSIIVFFIVLQVLQTCMDKQSTESVATTVMNSYTEVGRTLSLLTSQFYIALYYVDINYIYEECSVSEKRRSINKKLGLSML